MAVTLRRWGVAVLGVSVFCWSQAQAAPPDAGQLLNEQRQTRPPLPERLPEQQKSLERPALEETGVKVLVKGFRFSGIEGLATRAELESLLSDAIGRELGFAGLKELAERVTNYLRDKGYILARAYLPKQDVSSGIIEIAVIAGRVEGNVRINVKEPRRIDQALLEGVAVSAVPTGEAITNGHVERAVLLINDLPGMSASASIKRGDVPGTSHVLIEATEGPLLSGSLTADNYGDRYTGIWRGTGQAAVNDPFGLGDQFSLAMTGAQHMYQGRAAYSLPLGSRGVSWSISYTGMYYELGGDLASLNANGRADTISTSLAYPLVRSRNASLWTNLGFDYMIISDNANGTATDDKRLPVGALGISGSFYDSFGGGGLTTFNTTVNIGDLDLSRVAASEVADLAGPRTSGTFVKASYSLARLQRLTEQFSLFGSFRGQFSGGNLDSSEKFILGGPSGVRAYPVGEATADEGHAMTAELRYDLPITPSWGTVQLIGFIDSGYVHLHHDLWANAVTSATGRNDYWLNGGGGGVSIGKAGIYSVRASYAAKIGDNPGRTVTGLDTNNRNDSGQFWLQATAWF